MWQSSEICRAICFALSKGSDLPLSCILIAPMLMWIIPNPYRGFESRSLQETADVALIGADALREVGDGRENSASESPAPSRASRPRDWSGAALGLRIARVAIYNPAVRFAETARPRFWPYIRKEYRSVAGPCLAAAAERARLHVVLASLGLSHCRAWPR
jgi:hypothetical protein